MKKSVSLLVLLLGLMLTATFTVSAQNACSKQVDDKEVQIKVINKTSKPFTVNWVDHECKEGKSDQEVAPGETFEGISYNGHAFRVREVGTNKLLREIVINSANPVTTVTAPSAPSSGNAAGGQRPVSASPGAAQPAGSSSPTAAAATKFPIPAGSFLKKRVRYNSSSGNHYLALQNDGNLFVLTKDNQYVWSLDKIAKISAQSDRVELGRDGSFGVYDANGGSVWSPQAKRDPNAKLELTFDGALQLVAGNGEVLWSSDGILAPSIRVFIDKPNVKPCSPDPGWEKCLELADPTIKIMATKAVSPSAINGVANIYTEMTKRLGPKYPRSKLNNFKVYMTNDEPWSELANLSPIGTAYPAQPYQSSGDFLRGYGNPTNLWITEQMICKKGVKTRNDTGQVKDDTARTFDQVVHEFAHSIHSNYLSDQTVNLFRFQQMTPLESFPFRVQIWFGAFPSYEPVPANQEAVLKELFTSRATFSCEGYKP